MFRDNRRRLLETLARERAAAVLFSGSTKTRNADSEYRFRPASDFWYASGFAEPDSVLVLAPRASEPGASLFLRAKNRDEEVWTGRRLGVEAAPGELGVERAYPLEELEERLPELLENHERIVHHFGADEARDRMLVEALEGTKAAAKKGIVTPSEWVEPTRLLHEQRLHKNAAEIERMRRAAALSGEAHVEAMRVARPGMNEAEIDALIGYTFRRRGSTGSAYTNIVAGGENACILHYVENDQPLRDGDLLLIDAGAEWEYYASDVTRTFPIGGRFSREQRALYEIVLDAQKAAIEAIAPGRRFLDGHEAALAKIVAGLVDLGLLAGPIDRAIEEGTYRRFFMHRTGHWLGLDVHDCGAYWHEGESRPLEPGMVMTVEPGIYVAPDDDTVEARWRGIGIRIEDDVLVTPGGNENLTAGIPKEIEEVEAVCSGASLQPAG